MMLLERYIAKKITLATLVVLMAVTAIALVVNILGELRQVGEGEYGLGQAVFFSLLELPYVLNQFFPMLVLLGGLLGPALLAAQHELVVMRVSGFSPAQFVRALLLSGLVPVLLWAAIGEGMAPHLHSLASLRKTSALSQGQAVVTAAGVWQHVNHDFIHIGRIMAHQHLEDVTRYEFDDEHRLTAAAHAESMDYDRGKWVARKLARTLFLPNGETGSEFFDSMNWTLNLNPAALKAGLMDADEMSLGRLFHFARQLERGTQATEFRFSLVQRLARPLAIFAMLLLAFPLVFAPPRTVSPGKRLLGGVLAGFAFYIFNTLAGQFCVLFQWSPVLSALFPVLLAAFTGVLLLKRALGPVHK